MTFQFMRSIIYSLTVLSVVFLSPPARAAETILTLAIFDFESKDDAVRDLGPKVATLVTASLSSEPNIVTVELADLEKILSKHEHGLSGVVSPDTAGCLGHLTGAKVLVTGSVFRADRELVIVAKII